MNQIPNLKYKTTYCLNWTQGLYCEKGLGCYFAHSEHELRTIEQNRQAIAQRNQAALSYTPLSNYKTIFCKFYAKGQCKLGEACTYAHERREKKIKKNHTISYQQEVNYAPYTYYPSLNSWIAAYAPYYQFPDSSSPNQVELETLNEEMKMSTETISEERQSPSSQKQPQQREKVQKFELGACSGIQEEYYVDQNAI